VLSETRGGREGGKEGGREGGKEGGREGGKRIYVPSGDGRHKRGGDFGVVGRALIHGIPQPARGRRGRVIELEGGRGEEKGQERERYCVGRRSYDVSL